MTNTDVFRQLQTVREEIDNLTRLLLELLEAAEDTERQREEPPGPGRGEYLSVHDVAERYKVSPATIYRWAREGRFPEGTYWGPRTRRWKETELEKEG